MPLACGTSHAYDSTELGRRMGCHAPGETPRLIRPSVPPSLSGVERSLCTSAPSLLIIINNKPGPKSGREAREFPCGGDPTLRGGSTAERVPPRAVVKKVSRPMGPSSHHPELVPFMALHADDGLDCRPPSNTTSTCNLPAGPSSHPTRAAFRWMWVQAVRVR